MSEDQRRKLQLLDYSRIKLYATMGFTNREIAHEYGISTKYVRGILKGDKPTVPIILDQLQVLDTCSGCGRSFSTNSGYSEHLEIWAVSDGSLSCNLFLV